MQNIFFDLGLIIGAAAAVGIVAYFLRQPLILAYIVAGVLLGPVGFDLLGDPDVVHGVASVGIMLMLFLVGLEMNVSRLKNLGLVSLVAGGGQVLFTGSIGFAIISLFDFTFIQAAYLAVALTFSSTVIAVKLLSDKHDTNALHGQICIGILIVQDALAIMALLLLAGFQPGEFSFELSTLGQVIFSGIALTIASIVVSRFVLTKLFSKIALSHELLIIASLAWCFIIALGSKLMGFSMEIGAFIAGLSLANLPYAYEINAKATTLRDFFIVIFFAALGADLVFADIGALWVPLVVLSLFVLIGNPIIVIVLMRLLGYDMRTSFFVGLTIANISEFSLIVVALGGSLGHLDDTTQGMVAIIAILTMLLSTYAITYQHVLYRWLKPLLKTVEHAKPRHSALDQPERRKHIVILGAGQIGQEVIRQVQEFAEDFVVVDHNAQVVQQLTERGVPAIFGDVADDDILAAASLEDAELVISTIPDRSDHYFLLQHVCASKERPMLVTVAGSAREGLDLFVRGADYVILKPYLSAHAVHELNRELFALEKSVGAVQPYAHIVGAPHMHEEHQLAPIMHQLNRLRLDELIQKRQPKKKKRVTGKK